MTDPDRAAEEHYRRLERMYLGAACNAWYRPEIEIGDGRARITVPVRREFFHAAGAAHGSVCFKVLDDAAFFAANSQVRDVFVLTVSFQLYLLRPVGEGRLTAEGRVVHVSRRLLLAEAEAVDAEGQLAARGSGAFMPSSVRLSPELGYA